MMSTNSIEVIDRGLRCLSTNMGVKEAEIFISTLLRERFDYTQWRQSFLDRIATFEDLDVLLEQTKEQAHFGGSAEIVF